ncbi:MAG: hypothetical protein ACK5IQ_03840 [Bacteroidales bacterium]
MLKRRKWLWGLVPLLGLSVNSCINSDTFNTDKISDDLGIENVGLMLKLAKAELTIGDIFPSVSDTVQYFTDAEGNERIMFYFKQDELVSYGLEDAAKFGNIPAQTVDVLFTGLGGTVTSQLEVPLSIDGMSIQTIDADLNMDITYSGMAESVGVQLIFPSSESTPNSLSVNIPKNSGSLTKSTRQRLNADTNGNLPLQVKVTTTTGTSSAQLGRLEIKFSPAKVHYLKGTVRDFSVSIPEGKYPFNFGQLENFTQGIKFFDPRIILPITDNTGLSGRADMNISANMSDGSNVTVETTEPLAFNPGNDTISINNSNSNITDFTNGSVLPREVIVGGNISLYSNNSLIEMDEQSKFAVGCTVQIPMDMSINSSYDVDTVKLDGSITDDVSAATLSINSESELPVAATILLGLYDEDTGTVLDYVEAGLIDAAPVSANGIVSKSVESKKDVVLSEEELKNLGKAEKLIINVKLVSTDQDKGQNIVLLTNYKLNFDINIKGKLKLDL